MNKKILQKVIDNLNTDKPDLSYIRGILETLIESLPEDVKVPTNALELSKSPAFAIPVAQSSNPTDEASILDAKAKMAIETVKNLSQLSTQKI